MTEATPNLRVIDPDGNEFVCGSMTEVVNLLSEGYKMADDGAGMEEVTSTPSWSSPEVDE